MKHHKAIRKFGRKKNQRIAFTRGLVSALILNGKIETTLARAKEIRPMVERLVTYAKTDTLASKRLIASKLYNHKIETNKLVSEYAPKYKDVNGGYTRIIKNGVRLSDASQMAVIEFI
ncbi:MAG: 50S ribosomal protein L17 [Candidatus Pacebacteria bacterium]|nr:50S ribosomal protein L17 [Candidatus Paceibacterota bacterium]